MTTTLDAAVYDALQRAVAEAKGDRSQAALVAEAIAEYVRKLGLMK